VESPWRVVNGEAPNSAAVRAPVAISLSKNATSDEQDAATLI
jgi:hypothetical protein